MAARRTSGTVLVGVATAAGAVLGAFTLLVAARLLGPDKYASFAVMWAFYFALTGVLSGLQQETTRAVGDRERQPTGAGRQAAEAAHRPVLTTLLGIVTVLVLLLCLSAAAWAPSLFGAQWPSIVLATAVGLVALSVQVAITGALAARKQLAAMSALLITTAVVRALGVVGVASTRPDSALLMVAIVSGSGVWLLLLPLQKLRTATTARGDVTARRFVRNSAFVVTSTACAGLLTTGFPLLVEATNSGRLSSGAGTLFAAILLTRAPLLVPLNGYQLVILAQLIRYPERAANTLLRLVLVSVAVGLAGVALAAWVGPRLLVLFCGPQYRIAGGPLAVLVLAALLLVLLTLLGTYMLALNRHAWSLIGWALAMLGTVVALLTGLPMHQRILVALTIGPLLGVVSYLFGWRFGGRLSDRRRDPLVKTVNS